MEEEDDQRHGRNTSAWAGSINRRLALYQLSMILARCSSQPHAAPEAFREADGQLLLIPHALLRTAVMPES